MSIFDKYKFWYFLLIVFYYKLEYNDVYKKSDYRGKKWVDIQRRKSIENLKKVLI